MAGWIRNTIRLLINCKILTIYGSSSSFLSFKAWENTIIRNVSELDQVVWLKIFWPHKTCKESLGSKSWNLTYSCKNLLEMRTNKFWLHVKTNLTNFLGRSKIVRNSVFNSTVFLPRCPSNFARFSDKWFLMQRPKISISSLTNSNNLSMILW